MTIQEMGGTVSGRTTGTTWHYNLCSLGTNFIIKTEAIGVVLAILGALSFWAVVVIFRSKVRFIYVFWEELRG